MKMTMMQEMLKMIPRGRLDEEVDLKGKSNEFLKGYREGRKGKLPYSSKKDYSDDIRGYAEFSKGLRAGIDDRTEKEGDRFAHLNDKTLSGPGKGPSRSRTPYNESETRAFAAGYKDGDVVKVRTHSMGKDTGSYGKFNVLRVTPTQLHLTDHNDGGKVMKFSLKTKRGIGEHDNLLIKE